MPERRYYGQRGEDYILWAPFLNDPTPGVYLDIGALDGLRFSNTFGFEEQGWKGICVEAHPYYAPICKKNRPNAIVIHAAVTSVDKDNITFYANMYGSFSCLDKSLEDLFKRNGPVFDGYREVQVPAKTINTILKENKIDRVDVVSMDIEGTEIDALKGFDLKKYQPRILVLEAITGEKEKQLLEYMKEQDYIYANILGNNLFFCKHEMDAGLVRSVTRIPIDPITVKHPLDHLIRKMK